jgi:hypothetical protein
MSSSARDLIVSKSDQLNAEDLLSGPMLLTVTKWERTGKKDQPLSLHYAGVDGRVFKPCLTMRKVLAYGWGDDMDHWIGRDLVVFNDPEVKWGGAEVGGVRIGEMSDIKSGFKLSLTTARGKKTVYVVKKIEGASPYAALNAAAERGMDSLRAEFATLPKQTQAAMRDSIQVFKQRVPTAQPEGDQK